MRKVLLGGSTVVRAIAVALAALSLAWGVAITEGLVAAMLGAAAGSIAGEHLARSRLRLGAAVAACALGLAAAWGASSIAVGTLALPHLVGPGNTLRFAACLRFGALAFAAAASLRTLARRRPAALAVELAVVALSITTVFAAHRDGIIARPLWLSDWAWRQGLDPARILLGIGGIAAGILALLIVLEAKNERPVSSILVVLALAIVAAASVNALSMPAPDPLKDLGIDAQPDGGASSPEDEDAGEDAGREERARPDELLDAGREERARPDELLDAGRTPRDEPRDAGGAPSNTPPPPIQTTPDAGASIDGGGASSSAGDAGGQGQPTSSRDQLSDENDEDQTPNGAPTPMAVVLLESDYAPPAKAYYFREDALSQYNGSRLVVSSVTGANLDVPSGFPAIEAPVEAPPGEEGRELVNTTVVLLTDHTKPFALESPRSLSPARNPNPARFKRAYRAASLSQSMAYADLAGRSAGDPSWPPAIRAHYTAPPSDPRFGKLARAVVSALPKEIQGDPFAQALAVKLYLDKEVTYSTKAKHAGVPDPTADMLFGDRVGYCVHFAHAAVYLWRSLGIPSRIGIGYRSDEDNRKGGSTILLRASDAHAWPELYLQGVGWVILDVAPSLNLDEPAAAVDDELQRLLGQMARGEPPDAEESPRETYKIRDILRWIGGAGVIGVLFTVILLYLIKIWRRLCPRVASVRAAPTIAYRAALDALAEVGLIRRFGETREAFAERAKSVSPSFEALTWMHLAARLGEPSDGDPTKGAPSPDDYRAALARVRGDIAERASPWRRALGVINPASFLDAK